MPNPIKIPRSNILEYIRLHLSYDPDTGIISKNGKSIGSKRKDNSIIIALTVGKTTDGYTMHYSGYATQIAWYLTYDEWPSAWIDHIDGDRSNNKKDNLRLATPQQNSANQFKVKKNITSSKYKGVKKVGNKWRAYITFGGERIDLGYHTTEEGAARAYDTKALELSGEYAKLNFGENSAILDDEMQQLFFSFEVPSLPAPSKYQKIGYRHGDRSHLSKLTEAMVREIKLLLPIRFGFGYTDIGRMFGVGGGAIKAIADGKTWKHII